MQLELVDANGPGQRQEAATEVGRFVESGRENIRVPIVVAPINNDLDKERRDNVFSSEQISKKNF